MRIFLDTEFTGLRQDTELISIGLVSDSGECFYAEFIDFDRSKVEAWVQQNVVDNLLLSSKIVDPYKGWVKITQRKAKSHLYSIATVGASVHIAKQLMSWLGSLQKTSDHKLEIWADCNAYDWVLFRNLLAHYPYFSDLVYYIPFDLCTRLYEYGIDPDISRVELAKLRSREKENLLLPTSISSSGELSSIQHVSLYDAVLIKRCFNAAGNISGRHGRVKSMRWAIPANEINDADGHWVDLKDEMIPVGIPVYVKCNNPRMVSQIIIPGLEGFPMESLDTNLPDGLELKARLAPGFLWSHWWKTNKQIHDKN
jgi:hypothetical protein